MPRLLPRSIARVLASLLVTAFVVVQTVMRARQHVELRDSSSRTAFHNAPDLFRGPPSLFL